MSDREPDVSVVIVSRNTRQLLHDCLAAVYRDLAQGTALAEIIVVDNGSTDGSPDMVASEFPDVRLLKNYDNAGYGRANNQGIRVARGRHIFLLNSDTVIMPGTIDAMVGRLERHPQLGGVTPKLLNPDGTLQRSCWPFPLKSLVGNTLGLYRLGLLDDYRTWDHRSDRLVDWLSSAAIMIPRRVWDRVGLLDEAFFYGSDVEWQHRAAAEGFKFLSLCEGAIVHYGRGSRQEGKPVQAQFAGGPAAEARYYRKYYGPLGVLLYRCLLVAGNAPRWAAWELVHLVGRSGVANNKRALFRRQVVAALSLRDNEHA